MKINISPGIIIFILGFSGLVFCLADSSGQIGSKVPVSLFFLFIISIGIMVEMKMKDGSSDTFGEMDSPREFG